MNSQKFRSTEKAALLLKFQHWTLMVHFSKQPNLEQFIRFLYKIQPFSICAATFYLLKHYLHPDTVVRMFQEIVHSNIAQTSHIIEKCNNSRIIFYFWIFWHSWHILAEIFQEIIIFRQYVHVWHGINIRKQHWY